MFEPVSSKIDFPAAEREILDFWERNDIYGKTLRNRKGARSFVFFEGPPTANGLPHPGHCLTRAIKDVFPRYFTMRGYRCERKAGWDTHGLPVEIEVCKELGIHGKNEIEAYGIEPFNRKCLESVFRYTRQWEEMTRRIAFWVDLNDAYVTYRQSYIESVWWALKVLFDRGLLYQGHKVVWWWPQGGTALSAGEVGEGYRETDDPSIYVRFRAEAPADIPGGDAAIPTSLLAWTTTPWTLSSNVALAVAPDVEYVLLETSSKGIRERFVLASALVEKTFAGLPLDLANDLKPIAAFKGRELVGVRYSPPLRYLDPECGRAWEVDVADFVSLDQGTGVVHVAPAFGEDDFRFATEKNFGFLQMVRPDGTFRSEQTDVAGRFCKDADKDIVRLLKEKGLLLKREVHRHAYPFCPRAENDPLIQYARKSWFIRTTEFKDRFLANNAAVQWLPEHVREGRFGDFLRNNVDWAVSRERFWGTPLPIWECETTGRREAVGSFAELASKPGAAGFDVFDAAKRSDPTLADDLRIHRPYVDAVTYDSPFAPSSRMRRVPEVVDCWFDSGAMPFAQWGYPHQGRDKFLDQYPADFISEAIDQTRGWFYTLLAVATMLQDELGEPAARYPIPFRRCVVLGHMLGEDGKKMSKRLKNYSEPAEIFDALGADALRWYLLSGQAPWNSIRFSKAAIQEAQREFLLRLHNVYGFFVIYANIDRFDPATTARPLLSARPVLDRWILSELNQTVARVTESLDEFENAAAAQRIADFVDALSNWYVRRSRDRFWAAGFSEDKRCACWTLYECLVALSKLLAPFTPYCAEAVYQNLVRSVDRDAPESVHLCDWPVADPAAVDVALGEEMALVREVVGVGRSARTSSKIKTRQPLARVEVLLADHRFDHVIEAYRDLIAEELNVKLVEPVADADAYVSFSVKPDLRKLGPKFGKKLPQLKQALAAADGAAIRAQLVARGRFEWILDGEPIELTTDDVLVEVSAKPGYAAADSRRVVLILSTEITEDLRREGLAREFVHAVQGMRRDLELPFEARIRIAVEAEGVLAQVVSEHAEYIQRETLAVELSLGAPASAAATQTVQFDSHSATIHVAAATT